MWYPHLGPPDRVDEITQAVADEFDGTGDAKQRQIVLPGSQRPSGNVDVEHAHDQAVGEPQGDTLALRGGPAGSDRDPKGLELIRSEGARSDSRPPATTR